MNVIQARHAAAAALAADAAMLRWLEKLQARLWKIGAHVEAAVAAGNGGWDSLVPTLDGLKRPLEAIGSVLAAHNVKPLGVGSTRVAIPLEHPGTGVTLAVKLAWNSQGALFNACECVRYAQLSDELVQLVVPPLAMTPTAMLITPAVEAIAPGHVPTMSPTDRFRASTATLRAEREHGPAIRDLRRRLGFRDWATAPLRMNNFGRLDGQLRYLDIPEDVRDGMLPQVGVVLELAEESAPAMLIDRDRLRAELDQYAEAFAAWGDGLEATRAPL